MALIRFIANDTIGEWKREGGRPTDAEKRLKEINNVQNPTVAWARKNGCRATKLQGPGNRSEPDYMFRIPGGRPLLIEFKRPGEVPTPLQTFSINKWKEDGYEVQVHDTKGSAIAAIAQILKWGFDARNVGRV